MALMLDKVEGIRTARRVVMLLIELAASVSCASSSVRPLRLDTLWTSIDARVLIGVLCLSRHSCTTLILFYLPKAHSAFLLLFERVFCFVLESASSLLKSASFRACTAVSVGWSKYSLTASTILGDPFCSFPPCPTPLNIPWLIFTG
jgi:hypothetical protein